MSDEERPYRQIWNKMKEDLDDDLAEFFSKEDEKYGGIYFELLSNPSVPTELQIIRLLKKICQKN